MSEESTLARIVFVLGTLSFMAILIFGGLQAFLTAFLLLVLFIYLLAGIL